MRFSDRVGDGEELLVIEVKGSKETLRDLTPKLHALLNEAKAEKQVKKPTPCSGCGQ